MQINKLGFNVSFPVDFFIDLHYIALKGGFDNHGRPLGLTKSLISDFCSAWGCSFDSGCTKGVFAFKELGFVLKFSINDSRASCNEEYEAYCYAKEYGVERICAPVDIFYSTPSGKKFYIQPLARIFDDPQTYVAIEEMFRNKKFCERKVKQYSESFNYSYGLSPVFWKRCIQYYGWKFMRKVQEWAEDCLVEDLHDGNVGVVGNNRPVLVDYSGAYRL